MKQGRNARDGCLTFAVGDPGEHNTLGVNVTIAATKEGLGEPDGVTIREIAEKLLRRLRQIARNTHRAFSQACPLNITFNLQEGWQLTITSTRLATMFGAFDQFLTDLATNLSDHAWGFWEQAQGRTVLPEMVPAGV